MKIPTENEIRESILNEIEKELGGHFRTDMDTEPQVVAHKNGYNALYFHMKEVISSLRKRE